MKTHRKLVAARLLGGLIGIVVALLLNWIMLYPEYVLSDNLYLVSAMSLYAVAASAVVLTVDIWIPVLRRGD